jgi:hypothetical protein
VPNNSEQFLIALRELVVATDLVGSRFHFTHSDLNITLDHILSLKIMFGDIEAVKHCVDLGADLTGKGPMMAAFTNVHGRDWFRYCEELAKEHPELASKVTKLKKKR